MKSQAVDKSLPQLAFAAATAAVATAAADATAATDAGATAVADATAATAAATTAAADATDADHAVDDGAAAEACRSSQSWSCVLVLETGCIEQYPPPGELCVVFLYLARPNRRDISPLPY